MTHLLYSHSRHSACGSLKITQRLLQRLHRFITREVLHPHIAVETGRRDSPVDGWVGDLLEVVRFVPAGVPRDVVVSKGVVVGLDRADEVTLHDLHVIDVVEESYPRR